MLAIILSAYDPYQALIGTRWFIIAAAVLVVLAIAVRLRRGADS